MTHYTKYISQKARVTQLRMQQRHKEYRLGKRHRGNLVRKVFNLHNTDKNI